MSAFIIDTLLANKFFPPSLFLWLFLHIWAQNEEKENTLIIDSQQTTASKKSEHWSIPIIRITTFYFFYWISNGQNPKCTNFIGLLDCSQSISKQLQERASRECTASKEKNTRRDWCRGEKKAYLSCSPDRKEQNCSCPLPNTILSKWNCIYENWYVSLTCWQIMSSTFFDSL